MIKYDIVVIGGGPSGLMAAGRAAELGAKVLVLEKNQALGVKLLMSGGGRCNFTNLSPVRILAEAFGINGRWLLSGLNCFGPDDVVEFFRARGVESHTEKGGRVFPEGDRANDILSVLVNYVKSNGGEIKTNSEVSKLLVNNKSIEKLILINQSEIVANKYIIACGGQSYPSSGSNGDAYKWLKIIGHKIIAPKAALSQSILKESTKELEGLSVNDAEIKLIVDNKFIKSEYGDFLFTARGISGPAALNLSRTAAKYSGRKLNLEIDFFPEESDKELEEKIITIINNNKQVDSKNAFSQLSNKRLISYILNNTEINPTKKANGITRLEREAIGKQLKGLRFEIAGLGGFNEAMITVGGVELKEVDPKTMASKIIDNLYLTGEILDLDGPTGGFNLQAAWTTGYIAGENSAA